MGKATWGPESKENDKNFLKALLERANIPAEDSKFIFQWKDEGSDRPKLSVETTRKYLLDSVFTKKDKLSGDQLRMVFDRLKSEESKIITDCETKQGSNKLKFTLQLWSQDTHENLRRFEEECGKHYKEQKNLKEAGQELPDKPTVDGVGDVNVTQTPDTEQQSIENKKLSYRDLLPDCTHFQGRQNELKQLTAWLENKETKIIGIRGEGGIGKSTLTAKAFNDCRGFADKKVWFDVRTSPAITKVAERALQEFGMLSSEQMQSIEKKDLPRILLCQLQSGRYLLALDNLESLLTPEGEWLSGYEEFFDQFEEFGSKSVLLLAGREYPPQYFSWSHSEWLIVETGLEPTEGAALLAALEAEGTEAERKKVSEQVQGHPLALFLLAGWLRETYRKGNRSVQHLTQPDLFQVKGKHRSDRISVEEVFEWSFEQRLCPESQKLLTQVSVLRGAFNTEVAAKLMQRLVKDEELDHLERRVLLQELPVPDKDGRKLYRLQPRIQEFAQKWAGDLTQARERAIEYFRSQCQTNLDTATTQEDAKEYLEIFHHQCELQRYQAAAQTIFACNDFLQRRGYFQLLVDHYKQLDTRWQPTSEQRDDYACLCFNLGIAYDSLGQYKRAIEYQQQSLNIRKDIPDRKGEASCLRNLGNAYTSLRDYQRAIDYYKQSLDITKYIGDHEGKANSLGNLGNVYTSLKVYRQAINYYEQSLEIIRKIDKRQDKAKCLSGLGNVYTSLKKYRQAIDYYKQSLKITEEIDDRKVKAYCLGNLGNVHTYLKEYEQAIGYYKQSLKIIKEIGDCKGEADCLFNLGNVYTDSKQSKDALQCLQQALEIYKDLQLNYEIEKCKAKIAQNNGSTPPL